MSLPIAQHQNAVKTVVVPAAGMGTRFLPATKTIPKELLPVVDTPGIELVAKEAADLGAWNYGIGFGLMIIGLLMTMGWR